MYGPYECKDNRVRVIVNGSTKQYSRYLIEQHIGTTLNKDQHVHHKDGNPLNNSLSNLEIVDAVEHVREHARKYPVLSIKNCAHCFKEITLTNKQLSAKTREMRRGKSLSGYYCSRKCRGYAGK
jgi:hypothetical protein